MSSTCSSAGYYNESHHSECSQDAPLGHDGILPQEETEPAWEDEELGLDLTSDKERQKRRREAIVREYVMKVSDDAVSSDSTGRLESCPDSIASLALPPLPGAYLGAPGTNFTRTARLSFSLLGADTLATASYMDERSNGDHNHHENNNTSNTIGSHSDDHIPTLAAQNVASPSGVDASADGLLIAQAVVGESNQNNLPKAEEVDVDERRTREGRRKITTRLTLAVTVMVVVGFLLWLFAVLLSHHNADSTNQARFALPPTPAPSFSLDTYLLSLLPEHTLVAMEDMSSPQGLAYNWIKHDPNLLDYSEARIIQRYALATLYFSTNGDEWTNNASWLSYEEHECSWVFVEVDQVFIDYYYTGHPPESNIAGLIGGNTIPKSIPCEQEEEGDRLYTQLKFYKNNLIGNLPLEIYLLTSLQSIILVGNQFSGSTISSHVGMLTSLRSLALGNTGLGGTLPTQLGLLPDLQILFLSTNNHVGTLPSELGMLAPSFGADLDLAQNLLTGTLPSELGLLSLANALYLFSNGFTGNVPSQIGRMEKLQVVGLSNNQFTGTIHTEYGSLGRLKELNLDNNLFSGGIPSQIGQIKLLQKIDVGDNLHLTGTIPSELGLLTKLVAMDLRHNILSGVIPSELESIAVNGSLMALDLRGNDFSGTISSKLCGLGQQAMCPVIPIISDSTPACGLKFDCSDLLCKCDCPCP